MLHDQYDKLVARYGDLPFEQSQSVPGPVLDNDWSVVAERLRAWRADDRRVGTGDAARGPALEVPGMADMARRVRELEQIDFDRRRRIAELEQAVARGGRADTSNMEIDRVYAELEALRRTKLFRWTNPIRNLYSRIRYRRPLA